MLKFKFHFAEYGDHVVLLVLEKDELNFIYFLAIVFHLVESMFDHVVLLVLEKDEIKLCLT